MKISIQYNSNIYSSTISFNTTPKEIIYNIIKNFPEKEKNNNFILLDDKGRKIEDNFSIKNDKTEKNFILLKQPDFGKEEDIWKEDIAEDIMKATGADVKLEPGFYDQSRNRDSFEENIGNIDGNMNNLPNIKEELKKMVENS